MSKAVKELMVSYFYAYPISVREKYVNNPRKLKQLKRRKIYASIAFAAMEIYLTLFTFMYHRNLYVYLLALVFALLLFLNIVMETKYINEYINKDKDVLGYENFDKKYNQNTIKQFRELDTFDVSKIDKIDRRFIYFEKSKIDYSTTVRIDQYEGYTFILFLKNIAVLRTTDNQEWIDKLVELTNIKIRKVDFKEITNNEYKKVVEEKIPAHAGIKYDRKRKILMGAFFIVTAYLLFYK
ncbi:MAG: hypothetical protein RR425_01220 [Erysipelotrichales bacterium]